MKLTAPIGRTGTVMCSASGAVLQIDENGQIEAQGVDVGDLFRAGFSVGAPQEAPAAPVATFSAAPVADKPADGSNPDAAAGTADLS
jgi:hypothetical protein